MFIGDRPFFLELAWRLLCRTGLGVLGLGLAASHVVAQHQGDGSGSNVAGGDAAAPEQEVIVLDGVVVTGRRGAARLPPEIELGPDEIDNLLAYDVGEMIARLGETLGFTAAPVIIVNGRQVVSARPFLGFPPDAVVRVEVLPPQAAAEYGESPERPVVNVVLQRRFASRDGKVEASGPTAGGATWLEADVRQSRILDDDTRQFGLELSRDTALRADERPDYVRDNPESRGTTLRPAEEGFEANGSMTGSLGDWATSLSADARARRSRFSSANNGQVVQNSRESQSLGLSGGVAGDLMDWSVRARLQGQVSAGSQTGVRNDRSRNMSVGASLAANRDLFELPAGSVRTALSGRYRRTRSVNEGEMGDVRRSSQSLDLGGSLTIPLTERAADATEFGWGDASLTVGATTTGLLDGAGGDGLDASLSWSPMERFRLNARVGRSATSPADQMRFDPVYYGPPRTVFDFATGESVEVLPLLGGNPDLGPQTSETLSLSTSLGPFTRWRVMGRAGFDSTRSTDGFGILPEPTPAVEAAFPDRFIRDENGRLVTIDQRPINIGSTRTETLTSGVNFNVPPGILGDGTWQVGVNHTWRLTDTVMFREGLRELDRLAGDGGASPPHQVSLQLNGRHGKLGVNASVRWQVGTRVRRDSGRDGPDDLRVEDFTAVDVKFNYVFEPRAAPDLEGQDARSRRYQGLRLQLEIDNLFDARPEATLGDGRPAPGYGRDDRDPVGRLVRVTLSRRF